MPNEKITTKKVEPKKKVTKEVATKSVSAKKTKARVIKEAKPEQCFWVNNGPICKTHADLKKALNAMTKEQYAYHTKGGRNDFANWLTDVMGHHDCAARLKKSRTQAGAVKALEGCAC